MPTQLEERAEVQLESDYEDEVIMPQQTKVKEEGDMSDSETTVVQLNTANQIKKGSSLVEQPMSGQRN